MKITTILQMQEPAPRQVFRNRLNKILREMEITQKELSIRCGVNERTISYIVAEKSRPNAEIVHKILEALKLTFDEVFYYETK